MQTKLMDRDFLQITGLRSMLAPLLERDLDADELAELELDLEQEDAPSTPWCWDAKMAGAKRVRTPVTPGAAPAISSNTRCAAHWRNAAPAYTLN